MEIDVCNKTCYEEKGNWKPLQNFLKRFMHTGSSFYRIKSAAGLETATQMFSFGDYFTQTTIFFLCESPNGDLEFV